MQTYKTYKTTPGDVKNTSTGADQQRSYCSLLTSQRVHGGRWKAMDYFNYEGKQFILISNYFSKFHYFQSKNIMVLIKGLSN